LSATSTPVANILVADDTLENLRLLAIMLGEEGYEVRSLTSGRQALQAAERDPPDLILLDINMPDMNGYEVCRRLKASPTLRDVPVIFLTALDDIADKVTAFEVGGVDYITKPFQLEEVSARVRTHVALRRAAIEAERSYQRLRELERTRDDLVHMIVHDMRSPLMVLLGHLELIQATVGKSLQPEAAEDLQAAAAAARGISRLANDLLDVSRLEEGKLPLSLAPADLAAIAGDVRASIRSLTFERPIALDAVEAAVVCDAAIVRRVLENLLGNAIKHTPPGCSIGITVRAGGDCVRVEVTDSGPGVPLEARTLIFEKFGTVAARQSQQYHSTGLGLSFCKLAVEAHGGTIGVASAEPHGSVFWFELPVRPRGVTAA
jgi:two-component system sensor histidine kinase/response regulator